MSASSLSKRRRVMRIPLRASLRHLFDWRSPEERGVALVAYDRSFAYWQSDRQRRLRENFRRAAE
jgi:hypothetical protein